MATTLESPRKSIPGPKGHWLKGNLSQFSADRLGFLDRCARDFGDVVALRFAHRKIVVVNHPDLVEEVLVTRNRQFIKHFALRLAKNTMGEGLLTSEGDFWRRQRRLSQPAFHREKVAGHASVMVEYADRMLRGWLDGQRRDVQADMMRLTLEIIAKCLFDADVSADSADASAAMETVLRCFTARVDRLLPVPDFLPTPINLRLRRAMKRLDGIIYQVISDRRSMKEDRGDLLSMLLEANDPVEEGGAGMTDRQLRDEAMTLFMAGHETTANTLAWVWLLLSGHPEVEAKLHAELDEVLPDRLPTIADLPRLPYTERVVTEALRIYPTVWLLGREAIEPTEVGGHPIAPGTTIYMSQWVIHRDPRWFDDPLAFRPDRWLDGLARKIPRYAYFPFGGGPRICIGNAFAMMEATLLLATIARKFRPRVLHPEKVVLQPTMTLRPADGIDVFLEARR
ncbi:cytochrome P450 [Tundrisphaera lichenicola]|uniref:cytochrome P450 n=1 Tax=Tundrisphaera lichenicola TaxID=2029860 RepID=UPI003EBA54B4